MVSGDISTPIPEGYVTPPFPSLYVLVGPDHLRHNKYLYHISDVTRFTVYWTLIVYEAIHLAVAFYAVGTIWYGNKRSLALLKAERANETMALRSGGVHSAARHPHSEKHSRRLNLKGLHKHKERSRGARLRGAFDVSGISGRWYGESASAQQQQSESESGSLNGVSTVDRQPTVEDEDDAGIESSSAEHSEFIHRGEGIVVFAASEALRRYRAGGPKLKTLWIIPVVYGILAALGAFMAGSVSGALLGSIYNAGGFKISTYIPFVWSLINVLLLIVSSYSMQGGM